MDVIYDSVQSYLDRHFESHEIEYTQLLQVGSILTTLNPNVNTNATIIGIDPNAKYKQVKVLTDIGNMLNLTVREVAGMYDITRRRVLRDKSVEMLPDYVDAIEIGKIKLTYKELLNKANVAALTLLERQGYEVDHDEKIYESQHPAEQLAFNTVCWVIQTLHPDVDMEEVISYANDFE